MNLLTREALLSFRRAPLLSLLSVTAIAFSLFAVSLFLLVALNLRLALQGIEERVEVVAFVMRGTSPETIAAVAQDIQAFPEVKVVNVVTEEEALVRAKTELVEFRDAYRDLQVNPLPASLEIRMKEGFRDAAHVAAVAERVKGFDAVDDVRFGREWVERLDQLRNLAGIVGLTIGFAFAAIAIVIIGVTVRLTILQRAREIAIMRVVGATNWFIRGPFLLEGAIKGLLGGVFAVVLAAAAWSLFKGSLGGALSGLAFLGGTTVVLVLLFGIAMGLGASLVSVGRHLRDV